MQLNFPFIKIYIERNVRFYAKIDWILYKLFNKHRKYPCGQKRKSHYIYCGQPFESKRVYLSEDKHSFCCKVCNHKKYISSKELSLENFNEFW